MRKGPVPRGGRGRGHGSLLIAVGTAAICLVGVLAVPAAGGAQSPRNPVVGTGESVALEGTRPEEQDVNRTRLALAPGSLEASRRRGRRQEALPPGCRRRPEPPDSLRVPADFRITLTRGGVRGGSGQRRLVLEADGEYRITATGSGSPRPERPEATELASGRLAGARVRRIYAAVVGCDFFGLDRTYRDPRTRDGRRDLIVVRADGRSHSVSTHHRSIPRFDVVRSVLRRQVPSAGAHF